MSGINPRVRPAGRPSPRWAFMEKFLIPDADDPSRTYLKRLRIVGTPLFSVMLHHIYTPDGDRPLHDHPWTFWSLVLRGGYTEQVRCVRNKVWLPISTLRHERWSWHQMPRGYAHRISYVKPGTVTLIITGPRNKAGWGFYTTEGYVPWQEYVEARDAPEQDEKAGDVGNSWQAKHDAVESVAQRLYSPGAASEDCPCEGEYHDRDCALRP